MPGPLVVPALLMPAPSAGGCSSGDYRRAHQGARRGHARLDRSRSRNGAQIGEARAARAAVLVRAWLGRFNPTRWMRLRRRSISIRVAVRDHFQHHSRGLGVALPFLRVISMQGLERVRGAGRATAFDGNRGTPVQASKARALGPAHVGAPAGGRTRKGRVQERRSAVRRAKEKGR